MIVQNEEFWLWNVTTCKIYAVNKMFLKFKKLKMRNKEFYQIGQFDLMIIPSCFGKFLSPKIKKKWCGKNKGNVVYKHKIQ